MSDITTWFNTAAGNDQGAPPDFAPENGTQNADLNNILREMQASIRRQENNGGWFEYGDGSGTYAAVFISGNAFQIQGSDQTVKYSANTRVRITQSGGGSVLVGIIDSSVFATGDTDVTVILESGSIANAAIDSVELGFDANPSAAPVATLIRDADRDTSVTVEQSPDDDAVVATADGQQIFRATTQGSIQPLQPRFRAYFDGVTPAAQDNVTGANARYLMQFPTVANQVGTMFDGATGIMTAVLGGTYDIDVNVAIQNVDATTTSIILELERSDSIFWRWELDPANLATNIVDYPIAVHRKIEMAAGQTLRAFLQIDGMAGNTVDVIGSTDRNRTEFSAMLLG